MNFSEYQEISKRTMPEIKGDLDLKLARFNYALGLNTESGEAGDMIKKHLAHGHDINIGELVKEAGDVLHYLSGICSLYGISFGDVAEANIIKLQNRYPNGFSEDASRNRKEYSDSHD
ncbi:nucleoside triphosphate pyrophosphohydrolase family protein [Lentibacillus salicampi]|uniref:Nucleotide pyrophosphohydrolase n=1 Tax=Lentibacillus salicampi TaxID=175306 RepID=A0A4Y9A8P0_9BACI|nr:nucleoside triphosphate pyrophosphohydrolase family protein [Lentibacillus salicampi]TFJ92153.1 nucleotide pyrophosphohydrolase [Lentibacillus salicampi]